MWPDEVRSNGGEEDRGVPSHAQRVRSVGLHGVRPHGLVPRGGVLRNDIQLRKVMLGANGQLGGARVARAMQSGGVVHVVVQVRRLRAAGHPQSS